MRSTSHYYAIDMHSAGAQARVVLSGIPLARGNTINEKRLYLQQHHDDVRKLLMYEPRGGSQMSGSLIMPACDPRADIGIVFIESGGWLTMCGAGTIGAATALIESGLIKATEPETKIVFDTPAGLVTAMVAVKDGSVQGVSLDNVASYLAVRDHKIDVPGYGDVEVDIAYGGNFYVIVPASRFDLQIRPDQADQLKKVGREIRAAINKSISVQHQNEAIMPIPNLIFTEPGANSGTYRNMVLFGEAGVDRSPGGTGTSARMAQLYARGELQPGESFIHESIIGSRFEGKMLGVETVNDIECVLPRITGRAFMIAIRNFYVDPEDTFPEGFGVGYAADAKRPAQSR